MIFKKCKALLLALSFLFVFQAFGGGEIPWPLAAQRAVTEKNSKGVWFVDIEEDVSVLNVEIMRSTASWVWMRVSMINPETFAVEASGEGYLWSPEDGSKDTDRFRENSDLGSYVFMKPVDSEKEGFFMRLVELAGDTDLSLGISLFDVRQPDQGSYGIAQFLSKKPFECQIELPLRYKFDLEKAIQCTMALQPSGADLHKYLLDLIESGAKP